MQLLHVRECALVLGHHLGEERVLLRRRQVGNLRHGLPHVRGDRGHPGRRRSTRRYSHREGWRPPPLRYSGGDGHAPTRRRRHVRGRRPPCAAPHHGPRHCRNRHRRPGQPWNLHRRHCHPRDWRLWPRMLKGPGAGWEGRRGTGGAAALCGHARLEAGRGRRGHRGRGQRGGSPGGKATVWTKG
eukprot:scaffold3558_cov127-Isochrysis_galbana.AAC.1